jgi:hypothetical protein
MRLRQKLLVLAPALALATAGFAAVAPGQALAGTGTSTLCNDNYPPGSEIHLLTSPVTLEVESPVFAGGGLPTYVQVCYSTTSVGSSSTPSEGGYFFVPVGVPGTTTLGGTCISDPASVVVANCGVATNPSATFTPSGGGGDGGTLTLSIPLTFCFTTNLVPSSGCDTVAPTVGNTGVIVGTFALTPPPAGYTTCGGFTLTGLTADVNGQSVSLLGGSTDAGVNTSVVGAGTTAGTVPLCLLNVCAPGVWVGEQPISAGEVVVDGIPVAIPPVLLGCIVNLNTTCPAPY